MSMAMSHVPDLIILDLGLPDMDGIEVLRAIRQWSDIPVIVVSARGQEREKVEALDMGADDYITKPFGTAELLARIRTALRHSRKKEGTMSAEVKKIKICSLEVDYDKRLVTLSDNIIHMTPIEYKIVALLSKNSGKVLTHEFIVKEVWGPNIIDKSSSSNEMQALRVNMANIRRKIEENPAEPRYILTEVGVGYRMIEDR